MHRNHLNFLRDSNTGDPTFLETAFADVLETVKQFSHSQLNALLFISSSSDGSSILVSPEFSKTPKTEGNFSPILAL